MLAGCGAPAAAPAASSEAAKPAASSEAAPAASSEAAAAPAADTSKEVELTWYFVGTWPQPDQDLVFGEFNKQLKEKMNTTINFVPVGWADYDQKMNVIIASGEDYDICFTSNWTNNYGLNAAKGAYAELDELLPKYAPKLLAQVPQTFWDAAKINGKIYGVVNEQIAARGPAYCVTDEIAAKYNFDVKGLKPYDYNGLDPLLAQAEKDNPKTFTIAYLDNTAYFKQDMVAGWNIPGSIYVDDASAKVFNQFESPEVMQFAELMRDWNAKGYTNGNERIATKISDEENTTTDMVAAMEGAYKPGIEIAAVQRFKIPRSYIPAGDPVLTTSGICATMQAINRNSKNVERAMMFLELINTDADMYNLLNFGIKDKHFTIDADGFMVKEGDEAAKYAPNVPWMFATNFIAYVDKGMPKDVWQQTKDMNNNAKVSPVLGFTFNIDPVKAEAGQCAAVVDEYRRSIELGVADKAKYDEFVAKLKSAGSDKVIAEMQTQIDAWKAAK